MPARLGWIAALAVAYYVAGRLGLLLAIPPGYATAVWPPAGIALAAILLGGWRMAPGIWLGSFLLNGPNALAAGDPAAAALALAAGIATGATAQALLGAWLIGRVVEPRNLLAQEQGVVRILLLGGPLACLLNATVSMGLLVMAGEVTAQAVWFNAWTWWIGDSIGVLVFTPIVLIWAMRPYGEWLTKQIFVTLPLVLLFGVVVTVFVLISQREQVRVNAEREAMARDVAQELQKNLNSALDVLTSMEGLYASVDQVQGYQFEIFASRLLPHLQGVQGLAWIPWVPEARRAQFERSMQDAQPGFRIVEQDPRGQLVPAPRRPGYAPAQHVLPRAANRRALGFDYASEPQRQRALEQARDTGQAVVSASVALVSGDAGAPGVVVLRPAYRHGVQPKTLSARRKYLQGFVAAVFPIEGLMQTTGRRAAAHGLQVRLLDEGEGRVLLHGDSSAAAASSVPLYFAGRPWRIEFMEVAGAAGERSSWQVWLVLAGGLLLTSLLGMLLLTAQGRTSRVEALVASRTAELQQLNSHLTDEVRVRARLENDSAQRANELAEKNLELQRRDDITRELLRNLRRSEADLRRTAGRLAASNRELEQYAYVTSHDLKAPLRSVASFAQLLARKHAARLDTEAQEFLGFISDGVRHMQELIDDLLQLSRLDTGRLELQTVPFERLVEQACRQLSADLEASGAKVELGALPEVQADPRLVTQLLQNLIGNALKFQTPGVTPMLRIESREEPEAWHFTVADNGIGIDPRYLDQIFLIFKRLHTQDQYPGNGIGLAVCRKVMQLHGGEIWAESAAGQGTRFHFTLPRKAEAPAERVAA